MQVLKKEIIKVIGDYFIKYIKNKFPDLSEENEQRFRKGIEPTIIDEIHGGQGLYIDNDVSNQIFSAYTTMKIPDYEPYRLAAACALTFPLKLSFRIEKGNYVQVKEYGKTTYLAMSDKYKQSKTKKLEEYIEKAKNQIPAEIHEKAKADYIKLKAQLSQIKTDYETSEKAFKNGVLTLNKRLQEINNSTLSKKEKQKQKDAIIDELLQLEDKFKQQPSLERQYYQVLQESLINSNEPYITLAEQLLTNPTLLEREFFVDYVKVEKKRIYEEFNKNREKQQKEWEKEKQTNPNLAPLPLDFPNTSHLPEHLAASYEELDAIQAYKDPVVLSNEESENVSNFTKYIADRIIDYVKNHYTLVDTTQYSMLKMFCINYINQNIQNINNANFILEFSNSLNSKINNLTIMNWVQPIKIKIENNIIFIENDNYILYGDKKSINREIKFVRNLKVLHTARQKSTFKEEELLKELENYLANAIEDGHSLIENNLINLYNTTEGVTV